MPFVLRDTTGKVTKISVRSLVGAESLPHGHPDVVAFLESHGQNPKQVEESLNELRRTDNEMARAVEDIIMVLLKKNLIKLTDMPKAVQDRMQLRVKLRMQIQEAYDQASGNKA
jgi:hypothetical protein